MNLSRTKRIMKGTGNTEGQVRKYQSDVIMEATWDRDLQSRRCYIYDYYHDDDRMSARDLKYGKNTTKTPVDAKFIITAYGSLAKDQVEYHLQFKPSHRCPLGYYVDYENRFGMEYPVGLYIDIPDDKGVYRKWLICASEIANQFPKYKILPCNYHFHWVMDNKKYQMWGVARLRSSYNSG